MSNLNVFTGLVLLLMQILYLFCFHSVYIVLELLLMPNLLSIVNKITYMNTGSPKKTPTQLSFSGGKTVFSMATILPVNIGDMCVSKAAKYLSQAHFCS